MTIKNNPDLLCNKLKEDFGKRNLEKITIPDYVLNSLNPKFSIREYQLQTFKAFICYLSEDFEFKEKPYHLLFNMATGSGKTLIMAGCILYLYSLGYRNFLFFSTSNPIIEKTKANFLQSLSDKYLFNNTIEINNKKINVREVSNFEEANSEDINIKFTTIQKLHNDLSIDGENKITLDSLKQFKIVLVGDEAHHFNSATNTQFSFEDLLKDDSNWESTIAKILQSNINNILLEYTATIDWDNENIRNKYLSKCLVKYDLKEFREDGYSKEIKLFQSDIGIEKKDLILQAIILNQFRQDVATDNNINLKPIILFKANKTIEESKENFVLFQKIISELSIKDIERIKKFVKKSEKIEFDENGNFEDINYLMEAFKYYDIHDKNYTNLIKKIKINFAPNKCLNVNEYVFDSKKQNQKSYENKNNINETILQENILNSLESPNNEYRTIFAVNKLNEGWDVLNLFDIVRLYDTRDANKNKAGSTTVAEAQLIGRGARYYPFSIDGKDKFKRKYDNELKSPLRLLETIHYHSIYNSRYIYELRSELIKSGAVENDKIVKIIKLKDDFLNNESFMNNLIFVNECKKTDYSEYIAWDNIPLLKGSCFTYDIYSGITKETKAFDDKSITDVILPKITRIIEVSCISNNIKKNALLNTVFFEFNNLKKYIKDINSIDDFIKNKLNKIEIRIRGEKNDIENFSLREQYNAICKLLLEIRDQLKGVITEFKGSKEFKPKVLKEIFKSEKTLQFDKNNKRLENSMIDFIKNKSWYAYDSVYGTLEEKSFIEMFEGFISQLEAKYIDIKLIRNEKDLSIFNFKNGQRFEPDFILILKDKTDSNINYQVFIEPKGDHLKNNAMEKWKTEFLEEIKQQNKDKFIEYNVNKKFKIIGLPFYNTKEESEFRNTFRETLLFEKKD